jgi:hypothetical protein
MVIDQVTRAGRRLAGRPRGASTDEDAVVRRVLDAMGIGTGAAVDIAACDGITKSNTRALFRAGWAGLAVEGDPANFASLARAYKGYTDVGLARVWVTPDNVAGLLRAYGVADDFDFLNLDIDGYDHFVLDALLADYRPRVISAEVNEKIPPPVRFTVRYDPDHAWVRDHFYGQSISTLADLAARHDYALVELSYNNAFLVPAEHNPLPALTAEEAYRVGYLERPDRLRLFPWNEDMEPLHGLDTAGKLDFLRRYFARYEGRYDLSSGE